MLNFDRSAVKHGTQIIQNYCHQCLSDSFKLHQIRFRPGLRPGPNWGSSQRSPRPGLRGPTSKGEGRGGRGERERRREREGLPPPLGKFLDLPLLFLLFLFRMRVYLPMFASEPLDCIFIYRVKPGLTAIQVYQRPQVKNVRESTGPNLLEAISFYRRHRAIVAL